VAWFLTWLPAEHGRLAAEYEAARAKWAEAKAARDAGETPRTRIEEMLADAECWQAAEALRSYRELMGVAAAWNFRRAARQAGELRWW
jgi:hypothetical protein